MEIVTGSTGQVHVTPIDDAVRNASVGYIDKKIVFDLYDVFAATIVANREIHVSSGYGENQGRIFKIDDGDYDSVAIENGSQGAKRADLIVARYSMDVQTGFEDISLAVIKGELSTTEYIDPAYETGDINSAITSSTFHDDFPLYRVRLDGLQIVGIDRLFTPAPSGGRLGVIEAAFEAHKDKFDKTNYRTNLASESAVYPSRVDADGQGNINVRPGVEGVLPAAHGGTGQNNLKAAAVGLVGAMDANGTTPSTNDYYVGSTNNVSGYQRKPLSALWEYMKAKVIEFMGLTGNGVVPVAKGGTGKTSIGKGKVLVGNSSGGFDERGIDTAPSSSSNNLITSKGVADAMGQAGYGDMMKSTYDPNSDGIIAIAQGGTGANTAAGARSALGLGNTTGALPVANGGTGATTAAAARTNLGVPSLSGDTFTGRVNITNAETATGGLAFRWGTDTSTTRRLSLGTAGGGSIALMIPCPLKSYYGALELSSLDNNNGINMHGAYVTAYNYVGNGHSSMWAAAFNTASSRRYKENIHAMTDEEAEKLLDVDIVSFDYKSGVGIAEGADRLGKMGVIAEDVVNACPDVVTYKDIDGKRLPDGVDYSKFIPRLIKLVQMQEDRISELESRLNELES